MIIVTITEYIISGIRVFLVIGVGFVFSYFAWKEFGVGTGVVVFFIAIIVINKISKFIVGLISQ